MRTTPLDHVPEKYPRLQPREVAHLGERSPASPTRVCSLPPYARGRRTVPDASAPETHQKDGSQTTLLPCSVVARSVFCALCSSDETGFSNKRSWGVNLDGLGFWRFEPTKVIVPAVCPQRGPASEWTHRCRGRSFDGASSRAPSLSTTRSKSTSISNHGRRLFLVCSPPHQHAFAMYLRRVGGGGVRFWTHQSVGPTK